MVDAGGASGSCTANVEGSLLRLHHILIEEGTSHTTFPRSFLDGALSILALANRSFLPLPPCPGFPPPSRRRSMRLSPALVPSPPQRILPPYTPIYSARLLLTLSAFSHGSPLLCAFPSSHVHIAANISQTAATMTVNSPASLTLLHNLASPNHASSVQNAAFMREVGLKTISFNGIPRALNQLVHLHATIPSETAAQLPTTPTR